MNIQYKNKSRQRRRRVGQVIIVSGVFLLLIGATWRLGASVWQSWGASLNFNFSGGRAAETDYNPFGETRDYPVAVMIDNLPEARAYQVGLAEAVVVYETLAEGGSTRFLALFAGAPGAVRIGPVRSSRPYFVQLAAGWGAFYWHAGGSPEALAAIKKFVNKKELVNLNEISGLGPIYLWRDKSLSAPHNLFTSGEKINKAILDFELTTLPASKLTWRWGEREAKPAAGAATNIEIIFSSGMVFNPSYVYDAEAKVYKRSLAKKIHQDYNTKEQLAPANVIIQKVPGERFLPSGYDRIDFELVGEGEAIFFRDGLVWVGKWKKGSPAAQTEWLFDGQPFILKPGQTWVEIVPGERAVTYN